MTEKKKTCAAWCAVRSFVTDLGRATRLIRRTPSPRPSRSLSGTRGHSRAVSRHARGASSVVDVAPCVQWPCGTGEASCSCGSMGVRRRSRARCHGERMPARPAPRPRAARGRPRECSLRSLQVQFFCTVCAAVATLESRTSQELAIARPLMPIQCPSPSVFSAPAEPGRSVAPRRRCAASASCRCRRPRRAEGA